MALTLLVVGDGEPDAVDRAAQPAGREPGQGTHGAPQESYSSCDVGSVAGVLDGTQQFRGTAALDEYSDWTSSAEPSASGGRNGSMVEGKSLTTNNGSSQVPCRLPGWSRLVLCLWRIGALLSCVDYLNHYRELLRRHLNALWLLCRDEDGTEDDIRGKMKPVLRSWQYQERWMKETKGIGSWPSSCC